jgi:hypothetical protein
MANNSRQNRRPCQPKGEKGLFRKVSPLGRRAKALESHTDNRTIVPLTVLCARLNSWAGVVILPGILSQTYGIKKAQRL